MPAPLVAAIPWVLGGIGALTNLFKKKPNPAQESVDSLQQMLAAFPQLRTMMDMQMRQAQQNEPVRRAAQQMAINLAPRSAFNVQPGRPDLSAPEYGGTDPGTPLPRAPQARQRYPR